MEISYCSIEEYAHHFSVIHPFEKTDARAYSFFKPNQTGYRSMHSSISIEPAVYHLPFFPAIEIYHFYDLDIAGQLCYHSEDNQMYVL